MEEYMALQPLFSFFILNTVGVPGRGISPSHGRYLHTQNNKHRYPCLEFDSKPRSQCFSERIQLMP
jgi:hypothetical protein